jgi:Leucine-rich repeat (LRR) protein
MAVLENGCLNKLHNLKVLKITTKSMTNHDKIIINLPPNLKKFELSDFTIKKLDSQMFAMPQTLKKIILRNCGIQFIDPNNHFNNLDELRIENNQQFEFVTKFAPKVLSFRNCQVAHLALNAVSNVQRSPIDESGEILSAYLNSSVHTNELLKLTIRPTFDLHFDNFTCLEDLCLELACVEQLAGNKFACLSRLKTLELKFDNSGMLFFLFLKRAAFLNNFSILIHFKLKFTSNSRLKFVSQAVFRRR